MLVFLILSSDGCHNNFPIFHFLGSLIMLTVNDYGFPIALTEQVFKRNCIPILPRHLAIPTQEKERGCLSPLFRARKDGHIASGLLKVPPLHLFRSSLFSSSSCSFIFYAFLNVFWEGFALYLTIWNAKRLRDSQNSFTPHFPVGFHGFYKELQFCRQ